jgi:acetyl-CoA synthetase
MVCDSKKKQENIVTEKNLSKEINQQVSNQGQLPSWINSICIWFTKTRSGKIMRRILRKIAEGDYSDRELYLNQKLYWKK